MKLYQFISFGMAMHLGTLARAQAATVSNETYPSGTTTTVVGPTAVTTSGSVYVSEGANLLFIANTNIYLGPGFSAQPGSIFNATISSNLPAPPRVTLSPSATKIELGQIVSFTVSGSCSTGVGQIGLESCTVSGDPIDNLGLANVSGTSASNNFSWTAPSAGTFYFDGYAWDNGFSQLTRSPVKTITVIDPTTTITSYSFGTPNFNDGIEVDSSITDGSVQTGSYQFPNSYVQGYDSNGNFYHRIISQWGTLLTGTGPGYVAWVEKDFYHGSNQAVGQSYDQYIYDVYISVYSPSRKQWNVTQIGSFEGGPQSSPLNGDFRNFKFNNFSPTQLTWQVDQYIYNANGQFVYVGTLNYTTKVTGQ